MIKFTINTYNIEEYSNGFLRKSGFLEIEKFLDGDDTKLAFQSEHASFIINKSDLKMILAALEAN